MNILELGKEEFINNRLEAYNSYGIGKEEIESKFNELYEVFKEYDYDGIQLELAVRQKLISYFSKVERTPKGIEFEGIALGVLLTDYGAKRVYDESILKYNEDKELAIKEGFVKVDGDEVTPIYRTPGWKKGQKVELNQTKQVFMIAKQKDENDYKITMLDLNKGKENLTVPLFNLINFKAYINKNKSNETFYQLNGSMDCNIESKMELDYKDVDKLINLYLKDKLVEMGELRDWHTTNKDNFNRWCVVKGDISNIPTLKDESKVNIINITKVNGDVFNLPIFLNKIPELEINISEDAINVYFIGQTRENTQTGEISLSCYGFYCDKMFKNGKHKLLPNGG
jgi:hypothetical protein